ncbi:MAG: DNA mismatch repair endonuclease MutL, partial [Oscillospiraceae bacterium]
MQNIKVLPIDVANKIAAGEVAERPSSVVKELVENAIDAGAEKVSVEIKNGGIKYIRVTDDGCGIDSNQVETAFLRHATSKIDVIDDLYSIKTMGFRGEALASICAVAEVEVITKTAEEVEGSYLCVDYGISKPKEDIACNCGTTMIVKNLFSNVPARMKFLKKDSTESGYIADLMGRIALSKPNVAFDYICDDK